MQNCKCQGIKELVAGEEEPSNSDAQINNLMNSLNFNQINKNLQNFIHSNDSQVPNDQVLKAFEDKKT